MTSGQGSMALLSSLVLFLAQERGGGGGGEGRDLLERTGWTSGEANTVSGKEKCYLTKENN